MLATSLEKVSRRKKKTNYSRIGAIAQLGERVNGIHEVGGSTPPGSTTRFASKGSAGRPNWSGFFVAVRLLTNAVATLHYAKKPGVPDARQGSARGTLRH